MLDRGMEMTGKTNRGKSRIGYRTGMPIVNDFGRYQAEILDAASGLRVLYIDDYLSFR